MNTVIKFSFFFSLLIPGFCSIKAEEVPLQGTIVITTTPPDYTKWKAKRIFMQLIRENNTVTISSLLQPAAVIGSILCATCGALFLIRAVHGQSDRENVRDIFRTIELLIDLIKAPFTLQYEKNKARDRIAELSEELAKRKPTEIS